MYMGDFLIRETPARKFSRRGGIVRKGGTLLQGDGTVESENPIWVEFARSMVSIVIMAAKTLAQIVGEPGRRKCWTSPRGTECRDLDRAGESAGRDRGAGLEDGAGCRVGERGKDGRG